MLERLSNDGAKVRIIFGICKFWGGFCQEKLKNYIIEALNLQNGHKNPSLRRNKGRKKRSLRSLKGTYYGLVQIIIIQKKCTRGCVKNR